MPYIPDDPCFENQYAPFLVNAHQAWETTLGSSDTTIAVIDSGIEHEHPDLKQNFRSQPGYDFVDDEPDPSPESPATDFHGTHVAGIIGAVADNGLGIAGLTQSTLIGARVIDESDITSSLQLSKAIRWAVDEGADIINASIVGPPHEQLADAVSYAFDRDVLLVTPVGNGYGEELAYPASYEPCLAVSALDIDETLANYSNKGDGVNLTAPGTDIISTTTSARGDYERLSGTSRASPIVAGAAGLCHTQWELSGSELFSHLERTSLTSVSQLVIKGTVA